MKALTVLSTIIALSIVAIVLQSIVIINLEKRTTSLEQKFNQFIPECYSTINPCNRCHGKKRK